MINIIEWTTDLNWNMIYQSTDVQQKTLTLAFAGSPLITYNY
jgi:hypothetical protein